MAINGYPDPEHHRHCFRCHEWFEPEHGREIVVLLRPGPDILLNISATLAALAGFKDRWGKFFMCHGCVRVRNIRRVVVYGTLALLLAATFICKWLGVI